MRSVADLHAWLSAAPAGTMVPADRLAELLTPILGSRDESTPPPFPSNSGASVGDRCLKAKEVAARLRISHLTVYELVKQGKLGHVRVGRRVLIPETAFAEFVRGGGTSAD